MADPALNTNASIPVDQVFRIRFEVQETNAVAASQAFALYMSQNSGSYVPVTTSTDLRPALSSQFANGDATTNVLPSGTGTFAAGVGEEDDAVTPTVSFSASGHTELEFALKMVPGVTNNTTFDMRLYRSGGTPLDTYAVTPRVTAIASVVASPMRIMMVV